MGDDGFIGGLMVGLVVGAVAGLLLMMLLRRPEDSHPSSIIIDRDSEGRVTGIHYVPMGAVRYAASGG